MASFLARSITLKGRITFSRPADVVFRVFSPIGEKDWAPGWNPELLHPDGASWEEGLIFRTQVDGADAVWIVTKLDVPSYLVVYHRVEPERYVVRIEIRCAAIANNATEVLTEYSFIGLSERGNREIAEMTQGSYDTKMSHWATWINRYFEQTT
jgi:hypothetical protein